MKKIIVLNHKAFLDNNKAKSYPLEINDFIRSDQTIIVCPSATYILYFKGKYNFKLGSQAIDIKNETGCITGNILKSLSVKYALINKNDSDIKTKEALINGINPIIEIGESYYEYELNKTMDVINKQITSVCKAIEVGSDIIINYTPDWSFTSKQIPTSSYIEEVIELIKNIFKKKYNTDIKVLYGGEITLDNIKQLDNIKNIDGYVIDDISVDIKKLKEFLNIIE